jgi:hypothetical protein
MLFEKRQESTEGVPGTDLGFALIELFVFEEIASHLIALSVG